MNGIRLSVDYGTCHTAAVLEWPDGRRQPLVFEGVPVLPSGVYAGADGRLLAGAAAERAAADDPAGFEPHPRRSIDRPEVPLGPRGWRPAELIAATLAEVAAEARRAAGPVPIERLVMTHPVGWGTARRETLVAAATAAGLPAPVLVAEPVAAAAEFAVARGLAPGRCLIMCHLGGGSAEACVVRGDPAGPQPLAHRDADDAGGIDLDAALADHLIGRGGDGWEPLRDPRDAEQRRAAHAFRAAVRAARETLSAEDTTEIHVPLVDRDVTVTREEFDRVAEPVLDRAVRATRTAIDQAHVQPADVDGVLLTGGVARTPLAATLLERATGITPGPAGNLELVAAAGALAALPSPVPPVAPPASRRPRWLVPVIAGAAALVVLAGGLVAALWVFGKAKGVAEDTVALPPGAGALLKSAGGEVTSALSYDYRTFDDNIQKAHTGMTDRFRTQYDASVKDIRAEAQRLRAVVTASVTTAGLESWTADRATAMFYVDEVRQNTNLSGAKQDQNTVQVTLVRQHGTWLVDQLDAGGAAGTPVKGASWPGTRTSAVMKAANSCVKAFTTIDHRQVDRDLAAVVGCATGDFRKEYTAGEASVRQSIVQNQVVSTGKVTGTAVTSAGASRATVLVAADANVINTQAPGGRMSHYRMRANLTRSGDRWLVSKLDFVP